MTMKITNEKLLNEFMPALKELFAIPTNSKVAYNIAKTAKNVNSAFADFQLTEKNIIQSRCVWENNKPKKENNDYVFASELIALETNNELMELRNTEIELEVFPISIEDFSKTEISAKAIFGLGEFIKE